MSITRECDKTIAKEILLVMLEKGSSALKDDNGKTSTKKVGEAYQELHKYVSECKAN